MWNNFFLENIHFGINLVAALTFLAIAWLYFDAWSVNEQGSSKARKDALKFIGAGLLGISFFASGMVLESSLLKNSLISGNWPANLASLFRFVGYLVLAIGLYSDPLQAKPQNQGITKETVSQNFAIWPAVLSAVNLAITFPLLAWVVAWLYWRRATIGLERHLKPVAVGFAVLGLYELVSLRQLYINTTNVELYQLVAPFSPSWIIQHLLLIVAIILLGKWVFGYLLKRIQTQLFMIFTISNLIIFLVVTVVFAAVLLNGFQNQQFKTLDSSVKLLNLSVNSRASQNLSDAVALAQNPDFSDQVAARNSGRLNQLSQGYLISKKLASLVVVDQSGVVIARGEDQTRLGDSLTGDTLINQTLTSGQSASGIVSKNGVTSPQLSLRSAVAVKQSGKVIGAVMLGVAIDNSFVDGIKQNTGLEASVYADNSLSATTLTSFDGKNRLIGQSANNPEINNHFQHGQSFAGSVYLLNEPYFASFLPLLGVNEQPVGMLAVGQPETEVLADASLSIELTFLATTVLIIISILPAYLVARFLSYQLR